MKLYTARYADAAPNSPVLYLNRPHGNLFGELPPGTKPKAWGTAGDPWDGARLENSNGREILVVAAEYSLPPAPWYVRTDREFYKGHVQPYCVATLPADENRDESEYADPDQCARWLLRLFDTWDGHAIALAYAAAALPQLLEAAKIVDKAFAGSSIGCPIAEAKTIEPDFLYQVPLTGAELLQILAALRKAENLDGSTPAEIA